MVSFIMFTLKLVLSWRVDNIIILFFSLFLGQQQGQDGVKVQQATIAPVTVAVGGIANATIGAVSPDQLTQVHLQQGQQTSDQEVQPGKRLRRVACSCPNCREGEGR